MQALPTGVRTHAQKVCSFYKRALRNIESWNEDFEECRTKSLLLRKELDDNANVKDLRVAKGLLKTAEEKLFLLQHYDPIKFPYSIGGVAQDRECIPPDSILDFWDPIEKAAYPKYFALREQRKKEYIEFYHKQYPDVPRRSPNH